MLSAELSSHHSTLLASVVHFCSSCNKSLEQSTAVYGLLSTGSILQTDLSKHFTLLLYDAKDFAGKRSTLFLMWTCLVCLV